MKTGGGSGGDEADYIIRDGGMDYDWSEEAEALFELGRSSPWLIDVRHTHTRHTRPLSPANAGAISTPNTCAATMRCCNGVCSIYLHTCASHKSTKAARQKGDCLRRCSSQSLTAGPGKAYMRCARMHAVYPCSGTQQAEPH